MNRPTPTGTTGDFRAATLLLVVPEKLTCVLIFTIYNHGNQSEQQAGVGRLLEVWAGQKRVIHEAPDGDAAAASQWTPAGDHDARSRLLHLAPPNGAR